MPFSTGDFTSLIIQQLRLLDPAASAEVKTPERNIIEAVAELLAQSQVDFSVLDEQHNIDTMSGGRLENYLTLFGFGRQQGTYASGVVTFGRNTSTDRDITIPSGTQVRATATDASFPDIIFVTVDTAVIAIGEDHVDAVVKASTPGTAGNVTAGSVTGFAGLQTPQGITSVTNSAAMTGGTDPESDEELRVRFKNTIFRNMAGTFDQYMALAVSLAGITNPNVVGPISRYSEYITVPSADDANTDTWYDTTKWLGKRTTVISTIPYAKYIYQDQFYLTDGGTSTDAQYWRPELHFMFNAPPRLLSGSTIVQQGGRDESGVARLPAPTPLTTPYQPNITILGRHDDDDNTVLPQGISEGDALLLEFAYISTASRNDYGSGIMNCVDIFVDGENEVSVSSKEIFPDDDNNFNDTAGQYPYSPNWRRTVNYGSPRGGGMGNSNNSRLVPLFWQPVMTIPESIVISNRTFYKGHVRAESTWWNVYYDVDDSRNVQAAYLEVEEIGGYYGTVRARNGIEFLMDGYGYQSGTLQTDKPLADSSFVGAEFTVKNYTYDSNIGKAQVIMDKNKQVTSDVLVHKANRRYFRIYLTVMYDRNVTINTVNSTIKSALADYFARQSYGTVIQLSDILQVVHGVAGVDNVRWTADVKPVSSKWQSGHTYVKGDYVRPTNSAPDSTQGMLFRVTSASHSGGSTEPTWTSANNTGETVTLNSVTYENVTNLKHKVEEVNPDGSVYADTAGNNTYFDNDYFLLDNELAALVDDDTTNGPGVVVQRRSQNTWTATDV